jgi:quercetin dioxygenase-like cupin family protein
MADHENLRKARPGFTWDGVETRAYKEEGAAPFKAVTRQILFQDAELACELRYFEVAPGGYTTLERHAHVHAVTILRGRGTCLVGDAIYRIAAPDLVYVPPMTWHQFRASGGEALGFLCMVNADRDRPQPAGADDLRRLREHPAVAAFLDGQIISSKRG